MTPARHPYRLAAARRLDEADPAQHIADLVRLVLLTSPGGRLHRPGFGAGLGTDVLFEPIGGALSGLVELRARGAITDALGDRIVVDSLTVGTEGESTVTAVVAYRLRDTGEPTTLTVRVGVPA
ncbi:MAG TPA: GPW/gp25 family protein [Micromonosporaceae bacterium]|nr:GPW/gp25 family protein [Micromonosporaceae bacterium]